MKRQRHQQGRVYEASGKFYVQYRRNEMRNGTPSRVQVSEFLHERDSIHTSVDCKAIRTLRDRHMLKVNAPANAAHVSMSVADFWTAIYLPFAEKNLQNSTVHGYRNIWNQQLSSHFGTIKLDEYTTAAHSRFLTGLAEKYGRRTLNHIRAVASAIFSHALNLGYCAANPIKGSKALGRIRETLNTPHYTVAEAKAILKALRGKPDAALLFGFCFYLGLRPSEAIAVKWTDIESELLHVRRAIVRGHETPCKTPESRASLPLISQVNELLAAWRVLCPTSDGGWMFPRSGHHGGDVADLRDISANVIRPAVKAAKLDWKGLYAGRRGAATALVELTGNLVAAQELLRHKSLTTTASFYKKRTQTALANGLAALEAEAKR